MTPLSPAEQSLLAAARTATLATIAPDGRPRLVPVCFVLAEDGARLWIALDEKPKSIADPRDLARVRDVLARPEVTMLVDRWSEDWTELAWLRLAGRASLVEPADVPAGIVASLRAKYPQYATHALESRPMLAVAIESRTSWGLDRPS